MTDKEITEELQSLGVRDNPFDDMLHHALELARDLLFAGHRFRNPDVPETFWVSRETLDSNYNHILDVLDTVRSMSDETVAMCRETSRYYGNNTDDFNSVNKSLIKFEHDMQTVWSECVPCHNDTFEQYRLGKDSVEYKRLVMLREICTNDEKLGLITNKNLSSIIDVMIRIRELKHTKSSNRAWYLSEDEISKYTEYIVTYSLTEDEISYMQSYRKTINYKQDREEN